MTGINEKYGPWALVTGATSGIGAEFARQLAAGGLNLVIAARGGERLAQTADELREEYGVAVQIVPVDLAAENALAVIDHATQGLDVGLLVNNAGVENHGAFLKNNLEAATQLARLNAVTPMRLAHHFGRRMAKRGCGGIIFVSTTMAYQAVPFMANYSASKAYVLSLGEALHHELKPRGVDVTVLSPGLTDTQMSQTMRADGVDFSKTPMTAMAVEPVVRTALEALGRKPSAIPGVMNRVLAFAGQRVMSRRSTAALFGGLLQRAMPAEAL